MGIEMLNLPSLPFLSSSHAPNNAINQSGHEADKSAQSVQSAGKHAQPNYDHAVGFDLKKVVKKRNKNCTRDR